MFLRGTREHNTFRFYHEQTKERVLAYAVVLSGMESGKVKGSIYELDYAAKAELAIQTALRTDNNRLIYEKGSWELPKEYRFEATPDREYGKFVRYEAVPHDPDALRDLLRDESRKVQALQNKREFDERARENNYDLLYKNECQNWRNKINRVKNTAGFPADRLEKIQVAFSDFKKEALQRKKAVKTGTASPKEFTDWLYLQSNVIVELTEY